MSANNQDKKITIRIPHELHHAAKVKLAQSEQTFQQFFFENLKDFIKGGEINDV